MKALKSNSTNKLKVQFINTNNKTMKKIYILLAFLTGVFCMLNAQLPVFPQDLSKSTVIDSAIYIITYNVNIFNDPNDPKKLTEDVIVLQIGKTVSKSYSNLLYQADSSAAVLTKKGARNIPWFQEVVPPVIVYKNYPIGENTVIYRTFLQGPIFEYKESMPKIDWKMMPDKKTLLGYTCQKATGTFRGRTYEAWFSSQIPFKEGPYKFGGLPGLILQLSDTKNHYVFNCIGIQMPKKKAPILYWNWETQKTSREKLNSLVKRAHQNPADVAESMGIKIRVRENSGTDTNKKSLSYPYNPIELE